MQSSKDWSDFLKCVFDNPLQLTVCLLFRKVFAARI